MVGPLSEVSVTSNSLVSERHRVTEMKRYSDRPIFELPVVMIGIVPIYNLPGNPQIRFSGEVLAEIYLGHIKNWNDPAITKLNPGVSFPSMPINVIYRPAGKGSNYVFTEFLSKVSAKFRDQIGRTTSAIRPGGTGSPSRRPTRREDPGLSVPTPSLTGPASDPSSTIAAAAHARPTLSPGCRRPISLSEDPRSPRPGDSRLTASNRLVFPAPLGPNR